MRYVILFALIFSSLALRAQKYTGDSWEYVKEIKSGDITVLYIEEPGFAYKDKNGELTGVTVEIMQQFVNYLQNAQKINLNVNFVRSDDFVKFYQDVMDSEGGVFGLGNVTITEERKSELKFSPPYITNIAVLITHSAVPDLAALNQIGSQFQGFQAVVYKGTTHETRILDVRRRYAPSAGIIEVTDDEAVISTIVSNPKTWAYTDLTTYWLATQDNEPVKRHSVGDQATENFGIIMPLNSDWNLPMDSFFNLGSGYRSNPAYRRVLVKHLGPEVTKMLEIALQK